MQTVIETVLAVAAVGLLIPMTVFCAECLLSVVLRRRSELPHLDDDSPRTVVLIPAHNEESVIGATLTRLLPTLRPLNPTGRSPWALVLVVADNCTDATAEIARRCGAEVLEREDSHRRGKPFALQFGLAHLQQNPPEVVVFLDADCEVGEETVKRLSHRAVRRNRPVQGLNLCYAERTAETVQAISELGFRFKNLVRPLGAARLGLPCHLMGTGMAIPWEALRDVSFTEDHLAEDMQLGTELARRGFPAEFCPEAAVTSPLPSGRTAFVTQRTRWEQGHLRTILTQIPPLLTTGLLRGRISLLFLALDLTVPPLALLVTAWLAVFSVSLVAAVFGAVWWPAILLAAAGGLMTLAVFAGWFKFCRERTPLRSLLSVPVYVLRKLPIYFRFISGRRQKQWIRTERPTERSNRNTIRGMP